MVIETTTIDKHYVIDYFFLFSKNSLIVRKYHIGIVTIQFKNRKKLDKNPFITMFCFFNSLVTPIIIGNIRIIYTHKKMFILKNLESTTIAEEYDKIFYSTNRCRVSRFNC